MIHSLRQKETFGLHRKAAVKRLKEPKVSGFLTRLLDPELDCFRLELLTSSVQIEAAQVLLLPDGLVQKQSGVGVEASAEALDSKVVVGESQLKLRLLLDRVAPVCLLPDLFLLLLAELGGLEQIRDGRVKLLQTSEQNPSDGKHVQSNANEAEREREREMIHT